MGGNQSQQEKKEKREKNNTKSRIRDLPIAMCFPAQQDTETKVQKMPRSLSDNMRSGQYDFLTKLHEIGMPRYHGKLFQYLLTFFSIQECLTLRLVNKRLKFIIEVSNSIYATWLTQQFIRKMSLPSFVEYGSDSRFRSLLSSQLLMIELNQDEAWMQIYKKIRNCRITLNKFQFNIEKNYNIKINITDRIIRAFRELLLPTPILTQDVLKHSTNSWFQLAMAQEYGFQSMNETYADLDEIIEELKVDCVGHFSSENMEHAQLLIELRWLIIDNYINDPSQIEGDVPILLEFTLQIFHLIYLRCLYCRNVLMIINNNRSATQILNIYILLWKSYMGTIWSLNRLFDKLQNALEYVFNFFYKTEAPQFSFISAMGRIWTQIVLKGARRSNQLDTLEIDLMMGYSTLLKEKRQKQLEFFIKDQDIESLNYLSNKDKYFKQSNVAIDCLLRHFSSAALDLSLHEQSVHWIGHAQLKIGSLYALLLEATINDSHELYGKASLFLQSDFDTFREFIAADNKYLEEIINRWTVQVCIYPIGLDYLYDKIKINLRQYVQAYYNSLDIQQFDNIIDEVEEQQEQEEVLESHILPQNEQLIQEQFNDEVEVRLERSEDPLEIIISQIIKEEKLIEQESVQQQSYQKAVSFINNEELQHQQSKVRSLSQFSISTRYSSQITCMTSQLQSMCSYRHGSQIQLVKNIAQHIQQSQWATRLKQVQRMAIENKIKIDFRNNQVEMRNFVKKIPFEIMEKLHEFLDFSNVLNIQVAMLMFEKKNLTLEEFLEQTEVKPNYVDIQINGYCLANSLTQSHQ